MSAQHTSVSLKTWLTEPMPVDVSKSIERLCRATDVRRVAVMPDVHLASEVCVGVALATERSIYPAAIGSDIGCGMAAVQLEADASLLSSEAAAARVLAGMYRAIPSLKHRRETVPTTLPSSLLDSPLSHPRLEKLKHRDGRLQLGTLGRGNHFVELQADQEDRLWLMIHSGSRGLGQAITAHHVDILKHAGQHGPLSHFDAESVTGQAYLADVTWAIAYAEQNRLAMVAAVAELFQRLFGVAMNWETLIHSNHNHVRRETHSGEELWVHRKGALSATAGEPGVIPGSMGTDSFHVAGRGEPDSLCSSSHGAGRALSRGEAGQRIGVRQCSSVPTPLRTAGLPRPLFERRIQRP